MKCNWLLWNITLKVHIFDTYSLYNKKVILIYSLYSIPISKKYINKIRVPIL